MANKHEKIIKPCAARAASHAAMSTTYGNPRRLEPYRWHSKLSAESFWAPSRACGNKVRTATRVHKNIVDYSDIVEMLATYWRGIYVIPTYVKHMNCVTVCLFGGPWQTSTTNL